MWADGIELRMKRRRRREEEEEEENQDQKEIAFLCHCSAKDRFPVDQTEVIKLLISLWSTQGTV